MRLSTISGQNQQFLLLGVDEPLQLAQQLGLQLSTDQDRTSFESLIGEIVAAYSSLATGVLFSAELGYSASTKTSPHTGLIFCLERTLTEVDPLSIPVLQSNWNVEHIRNNDAVAKLCVYAQPKEEELITKLELINELYDSCRYEGIDFLLELHVIDGHRLSDEVFQEQQLRLIRFFHGQFDLLALEYPRTAVGCLTVTAELRQPWVMVESPTTMYPVSKEELRTALTGGAAGIICRRLEVPEFKKGTFNLDEFRSYVQKEGRDRFLELSRICQELTISGGSK